ncbi:LuxR C-terminal-related transcriptional regulator [Streptomyces sp. NPDC048258]|uniref:LuxR C-terminal-related transcriptional regulator n=1 Tax=Streptomyces sp. NPDC048258 TaxID=3365527 RepID=UPI00371F516B
MWIVELAFTQGPERLAARPAHREKLTALHEKGLLRMAGPLADPIEFDATHHFPPQLTDEIQRTILELMVKGHTDEAISKRLGLSARSIGTHIKRASSLFGSRSRAEVGYSLAKAGVLGLD